MTGEIPLVDLGWQHREIADEVEKGWRRILERMAFVGGEEVEAFESAFASAIGVRHCIGLGNGTDAVELALRAFGIGLGDDVLVPANTFVATAMAVVRTGARPVFADVDDRALLLDPAAAAAARTPRTRAVIPVHLYGQAAPVDWIRDALGDGVIVIEDAAQSQGATRNGRRAGSLGTAAATSFYPGKNLGAYGDAGAALTDDDEVAIRLRRLRNHGGVRKYEHVEEGFNSRLDSLQAVVLAAKLERLDGWNGLRDEAARRYDALLADFPVVRGPVTLEGNQHVWHLYVVRMPKRDGVLERLLAAGVGAAIHYPTPLPLLPAFIRLGYRRGDFPVTERAATEILSLPLYPGIIEEQQVRVIDVLREALP